MNSTLGERIMSKRKLSGLTRPEACKRLNISISSLQGWENNIREPQISNLIEMANLFNTSTEYLIHGKTDTDTNTHHSSPSDDEFINIQDTKLTEEGLITKNYHFRKDWIKKITSNPQRLAIYSVKDDGMSPSINKGDIVLIETYSHKTSNRIIQGRDTLNGLDDGLYVIRINGRLTLRRIQFNLGGQILVKPDNKVFDAFTFNLNELEPSSVVGKVLWYCHEV